MTRKVDLVLQKIVDEMKGLTVEETKEFITEFNEFLRTLVWLMTIQAAFADWDNEEDSIYDDCLN